MDVQKTPLSVSTQAMASIFLANLSDGVEVTNQVPQSCGSVSQLGPETFKPNLFWDEQRLDSEPRSKAT